jgi:hypothetical protein
MPNRRKAFVVPKRVPKSISGPMERELQRLLKEKTSPAKVDKFIRTLIDKAARGKSSTATRLLKELSKPLSVKLGSEILKLTKTPGEGVTAPLDSEVPFSTNLTVRNISGANRLYAASEHKVNFKSGLPEGRWLRNLKQSNGESVLTTVSTIVSDQGSLSVNRTELVQDFGFNQKLQLMVNTDLFGFTINEMYNEFKLSTLDSSHVADQIVYGAVSKLSSMVTITNLNRYVPAKLKLHLCRITNNFVNYATAFDEGLNDVSGTQIEGAMPEKWQLSFNNTTNYLGIRTLVDPATKGIKAAPSWRTNIEIVDTCKVKLSAGDHAFVKYVHELGRGLRVDKIYGMEEDNTVSSNHPITYVLFIEAEGEKVEAVSNTDSNKIYKGTSIGSLSFEFKKQITGSRPVVETIDMQNAGSYKGWRGENYAIRVYSKRSQLPDTSKTFNVDFVDVKAGVGGTHNIPIMSDAIETEAGRNVTP